MQAAQAAGVVGARGAGASVAEAAALAGVAAVTGGATAAQAGEVAGAVALGEGATVGDAARAAGRAVGVAGGGVTISLSWLSLSSPWRNFQFVFEREGGRGSGLSMNAMTSAVANSEMRIRTHHTFNSPTR